jgi:hypothetical protein
MVIRKRLFSLIIIVFLAAGAALALKGCPQNVTTHEEQSERPSIGTKQTNLKNAKSISVSEDVSLAQLLLVETVQRDLCLTTDQIGKIRDILNMSWDETRKFHDKYNEIFPPSKSFPAKEFEERQRELQSYTEDYKSKGKDLRMQLLNVLTPSQSERLKQIHLQAAIPATLIQPEIVTELDISEDQYAKLRALYDSTIEKQLTALSAHPYTNSTESRQKYIEAEEESDKIYAEAKKPMLDILTPEQRAKFDKMVGTKIEVKWSYEDLIPENAEF